MADYLTPETAARIRHNLSVQPEEDRSALLDALRGVVGCLAWHVEEQGRGVAMDAEYLRRARAVVAQAEGRAS